MKKYFVFTLILFLISSITVLSQTDKFFLNISISNNQCDSIMLLEVELTNNSISDIIFPNADFFKIKENYFWINGAFWDIIIYNCKNEKCYTEGHFIYVNKDPDDLSKILRSYQSYKFNIPINKNRIGCLDDKDFNNPNRRGEFSIQFKMNLIKPEGIELLSNIIYFQIE